MRTTTPRPSVAARAGAAGALLLVGIALAASEADPAGANAPLVYFAEVEAIIHPISAEYMVKTMDLADQSQAALTVFRLRTPGGLVDSTRTIVERMLRATTPVAIFVAPPGARAASAGFLLTIAADVAAMAPGTHIGAAHPVSVASEGKDETRAKKAAEDVAAYARTLSAARRRNVELAQEAVVNSRAFTEQEALGASPPLIDLVAADLPDLLAKLDGRTIRRFDGTPAQLKTAGATVTTVAMTRRQRILSAIAHPNIAYILLSLGVLGLTIELWSPGAIFPGVVGALSLLLAFFSLQMLPVNYVGLLLMVLGLLLLALEIKVTSYGLLTVGGAVSLIFGSLLLIDSPAAPELRLSLRFVLPVVVGCVAVASSLVWLGIAAQRAPATAGAAGMIGLVGRTLSVVGPDAPGQVAVHGETWRARADETIERGAMVRVTHVDGLTVTVRRE
jgi:membrane-bound serine protease (ClpP class)